MLLKTLNLKPISCKKPYI